LAGSSPHGRVRGSFLAGCCLLLME
jgi:hypothetical protein